ncbi:MAG: EamA family transporter RarD [Anaerolineae bacterium]|nr:EamA family transporter RarD [Anaerolineae bacterium]MCB0201140.1 EamA family transporter RarD [Anaerolineae bacterium]MCB0205272.1 EamA family transporter RarD [Anaerolineae bacterium]MCB0253885.1 EamA family transporter RarD [Anaerolineae bacterium]
MRRGTLLAGGAYVIWGVLPIYWKAMASVSPQEILVHRILWSLVVCLILLAALKNWQWLRDGLRHPAVFRVSMVTAVLLAVNWLTYIWATNNDHIVEASLGYFITPLVNVLLGIVILHERLRVGQLAAILVATLGVIYLIVNAGGLLWISFALALSFGIYGLLRKTSKLGSLEGLSIEMMILTLPAALFLLMLAGRGESAFATQSWAVTLLLASTGIVTAGPLLLFASGARLVPLTTLGVLQYLAPTLQFLIGVLIYGEPFTHTRLIGFGIIWAALAIYTAEGFLRRRRQRQLLPTPSP